MRISDNHPCHGGCGRIVSANKKMCVRCMAIEVREALDSKGIESDEDDLRRMIMVNSENL